MANNKILFAVILNFNLNNQRMILDFKKKKLLSLLQNLKIEHKQLMLAVKKFYNSYFLLFLIVLFKIKIVYF